MNIKFYPDKADRPKTVLMMSVTFEGNRIKFSTGLTVENINWDSSNKSVKKRVPKGTEINAYLQRIELKVTEFYNECLNSPKIQRKELLTKKIKEMLSPGSTLLANEQKQLIACFEDFINKRQNSQDFSESSISNYNHAKLHLEGYQKFTNKILTFDSIDSEFFDSFTTYLTKRHNLARNTVGNLVKELKVFMNEALKIGISSNTSFKNDLKVWESETTAIALDEEDIEKLSSLNLDDNKDFREIRDLFLLQIYTGLRFSDLSRLTPEKINMKDEIITLNVKKTKQNLVIPLFNKTKEILNNYPDFKLPTKTECTYNKKIKKICQLAGIDDPIVKTIYIGKERKEEIKKKYEMVSSHTARRTFITICLKKELHPRYIMPISGHRDIKSFDKYIKLTNTEVLDKVRKVFDR